jgi:transposase-like protein
MNKHRRTWSITEKLEALQLLKKDGVGKASRQLEISSTTLYKWQAQFESKGEMGLSEKQENKRNIELENLKKENRELKFLVAEKELSIRVLNELLKKNT